MIEFLLRQAILYGMVVRDRALLIYDGSCSYCRRFADMALRMKRDKNLITLAYTSESAQDLLKAQFGTNIGFTMYLFHGTRVFWAQSAAKAVIQLLGLPRFVGWLAFVFYPSLVRGISWLTGRRQAVCMPGQGVCFRNRLGSGSMPMTDDVREQLASLK